MLIADVCQALERHQVPYALVGGHAVALHGAVRGTVDVDLVIEWSLEHLEAAVQALEGLGLRSALPISARQVFTHRNEYIQQRNLIEWNFVDFENPLRQVDLLINFDLSNHPVINKSTRFGEIRVLNKRDLIAMKRRSGRPQDMEDVRILESL